MTTTTPSFYPERQPTNEAFVLMTAASHIARRFKRDADHAAVQHVLAGIRFGLALAYWSPDWTDNAYCSVMAGDTSDDDRAEERALAAFDRVQEADRRFVDKLLGEARAAVLTASV